MPYTDEFMSNPLVTGSSPKSYRSPPKKRKKPEPKLRIKVDGADPVSSEALTVMCPNRMELELWWDPKSETLRVKVAKGSLQIVPLSTNAVVLSRTK